jgi:uncharacterized protein
MQPSDVLATHFACRQLLAVEGHDDDFDRYWNPFRQHIRQAQRVRSVASGTTAVPIAARGYRYGGRSQAARLAEEAAQADPRRKVNPVGEAVMRPVTHTIVLQASPFCNIDCNYCYLSNRSDKTRMGVDRVGAIFAALAENLELADELAIVWHSGEPLVLGPQYYLSAIAAIRDSLPSRIDVEFDIQTNGTLLTHRWRSVYGRPDVSIGLSLDGPREIHDRARRYRDGRGSFDGALAALHLLQEEGCEPSVIAVLDFDFLSEPERYYDFFREEGVRYLSFNIPECEGVNERKVEHDLRRRNEFAAFMRYFHRRNEREGRPFSLTHIDAMARNLRVRHARMPRSQEQSPLSIITVGVDGRFSTFSPELLGFQHPVHGDFRVGSAYPQFSLDIEKLDAMTREIEAGLGRCESECKYFSVCGGGHPSAKYFDAGNFAATEHTSCLVNTRWLAEAISEELLSDTESDAAAPGCGDFGLEALPA